MKCSSGYESQHHERVEEVSTFIQSGSSKEKDEANISERKREGEREERMRRLPDSNLRGIQNRGKGGDKKLL